MRLRDADKSEATVRGSRAMFVAIDLRGSNHVRTTFSLEMGISATSDGANRMNSRVAALTSAARVSVQVAEGSKPPQSAVGPSVLVFRENIAYNRLRRCFDIFGAFVMLLFAAPILCLAGLAIILEGGPPVFFRQHRVGRFGRLFVMYKLRTMRKDKCVDDYSPTTGRDPRITRVGHWLRRSSIDELPQLINIIRGEMALVGPRPEMPFVVRDYKSWQHLRHLVTPGVTGFWQTTCRSTVPLHLPEATMLDLEYIRQASHSTDAAVLVKTVRRLISTEGAF